MFKPSKKYPSRDTGPFRKLKRQNQKKNFNVKLTLLAGGRKERPRSKPLFIRRSSSRPTIAASRQSASLPTIAETATAATSLKSSLPISLGRTLLRRFVVGKPETIPERPQQNPTVEKGEVLEGGRLKKSREVVTEPEQESGLSVELLDSAVAPSVGSSTWLDSTVVANSKAVEEAQIEAGTRSSYRI
jgi:hypothetical protein